MKRRLIIRIEAEVDITDSAVWYQKKRAGLGYEFLAEVESAIQKAVTDPKRYAKFRSTPEVRRILTDRFPHRVFYTHLVKSVRAGSSQV